MVLKGVDEIDWLTDRPDRVAGEWSPKKLVKKWDVLFSDGAPNAQMSYTWTTFMDFVGAMKGRSNMSFEMHKPSVNKKGSKLSFEVKGIGKKNKERVAAQADRDLEDISLFIDGETNANLSGANLSGATLTNIELTKANLTSTNLTDTILGNANLGSANLTNTNLTDANLYGVSLAGANLSDANLTSVYLADADLTGANLTDANLTGVTMTLTDLTGANLAGTILDDAGWKNTTCPDGTMNDGTSPCTPEQLLLA